jgi:drug/metabolite transporter (DMT)-like permease
VTISTSILLATASMVLFGLGDFAIKRAADMGVRPHHAIMVQAWFFSTTVVIYALATGTLVLTPAAMWGAVAGLFMLIGFTAFMRSLIGESVSIQAPVFRLNFIVTASLAFLFLGETLTVNKALALLLALLAVWLLLGSGKVTISRRALGQVLLATLMLGLGNTIYKIGLRQGAVPETLVVTQAMVFVTLATVQVLAIDRRIAPPAAAFRYPPVAAILLAAAFVLLVRGLSTGEASVVVPISQMGFVVTAVLGVGLLGEHLTLRKAGGLIAAVLSLAAFAV